MKFFTGAPGMTRIITSTKIFFDIMSFSSGGHLGYFRAYFGILRLPFENRLICSHEILYKCSWCSFQFILGNVPLVLHNCLIFSQETLYRCSWYNTLIITSTIFFLTPCPPLQGVVLGLILAYYVYF